MPFEKEPQFFKPDTERIRISKAKEKDAESLELRREGELVYSREFKDQLNNILEHEFTVGDKEGREERVVLKNTINKHLEKFSAPEFPGLSTEQKGEAQKQFIKDFIGEINKISPGDPWSFYFERAMKTGKINCAGCAALTGMILENAKEKAGIKNVEYGMPYGHAVNLVTLEDGRLYFVDSRNNMFEDITDYTKSEEKEGLKVYRIKQPEKTGYQIVYQIVPVDSLKEGIIGAYLGNLHSAYQAAEGKFDDALKMGRSKEKLREIQSTAKEVCRQKQLFLPGQPQHLKKIQDFFSEKFEKYEQSDEFKEEKKRIEKIIGK